MCQHRFTHKGRPSLSWASSVYIDRTDVETTLITTTTFAFLPPNIHSFHLTYLKNMPKRKRNTESCRPNKKQNTSSLGLDAHTRTDPFTLLPWDCASIVLQHLDIRDLACCEQVSGGWRRFVQHWMVVSGHQYCLPDRWRPDISNQISYEDALAAVKKSGTLTST